MVISKAARDEYESVRFFYHSMIDALEGTKYHPSGRKTFIRHRKTCEMLSIRENYI
jgi:hypothetical protein